MPGAPPKAIPKPPSTPAAPKKEVVFPAIHWSILVDFPMNWTNCLLQNVAFKVSGSGTLCQLFGCFSFLRHVNPYSLLTSRWKIWDHPEFQSRNTVRYFDFFQVSFWKFHGENCVRYLSIVPWWIPRAVIGSANWWPKLLKAWTKKAHPSRWNHYCDQSSFCEGVEGGSTKPTQKGLDFFQSTYCSGHFGCQSFHLPGGWYFESSAELIFQAITGSGVQITWHQWKGSAHSVSADCWDRQIVVCFVFFPDA